MRILVQIATYRSWARRRAPGGPLPRLDAIVVSDRFLGGQGRRARTCAQHGLWRMGEWGVMSRARARLTRKLAGGTFRRGSRRGLAAPQSWRSNLLAFILHSPSLSLPLSLILLCHDSTEDLTVSRPSHAPGDLPGNRNDSYLIAVHPSVQCPAARTRHVLQGQRPLVRYSPSHDSRWLIMTGMATNNTCDRREGARLPTEAQKPIRQQYGASGTSLDPTPQTQGTRRGGRAYLCRRGDQRGHFQGGL